MELLIMKRLSPYIALLLAWLTLSTQAANHPVERLHTLTDKRLYLSGELLWLKLCLTDEAGLPLDDSRIGYVELLDESGPVAQAQIALQAGVGEGWLELPAPLPSGYYRLVAYTRQMRNQGEADRCGQLIAVVNTLREAERVPSDSALQAPSQPTESNLRLTLDRSTLARREQGTLRIEGLPANLHTLAVSIAGEEFMPLPDLPTAAPIPSTATQSLIDYEGAVIEGTLIDLRTGETAQQTNGVTAWLGGIGNEIQLFSGQIDATGTVRFYTKGLNGVKEMATTTQATNGGSYRVDLQSPFATHPALQLPPLKVNPAWRRALTQRHVGLQVTRLFTADSMSRVEPSLPLFHWTPTKSYRLEEYTRFPTMGETIFEFVEAVSFRTEQGRHNLFVLLSDLSNNSVSLHPPLVLLDGIPLLDPEWIYRYDPALVERIDVYRDRYAFGGQQFEGIVAFYTHRHNYPTLKLDKRTQLFDFAGTQPHRRFYAPDYADTSARESRLPDYRHTLLWLPEVETNGSAEVTLPFSTSDLPGRYRVSVEGITREGQRLSGYIYLLVERN